VTRYLPAMRAPVALLMLLCACKPQARDSDAPDLAGLLGILITPEEPAVPVGGVVQLTATGLMEDRSSQDLTAVVEWTSDDPSVARVTDGLDAEGEVEGLAVGEAKVWAEMEGVRSVEAMVRVIDAEIVGITVEPERLDLTVGDEVKLTAQTVWSDGTRSDGSGNVRWITADGDVATVASGGLVTAEGVGETTVKAAYEDAESNAVDVVVKEPVADAKPDVYVAGATAEVGGGYVTLTVTVANRGNEGASGFYTDVFVDPAGAPEVGDYGDDWALVDYVGASSSTQISFSLPLDDGTHEIAILVDSSGDVAESDESNNGWSTEVDVGGGTVGGPNLTVTYFDWLADETSLYYAVDVYNSGTEPVSNFYVDIYVDQATAPTVPSDGDTYVEVLSLGAGETEFADFLLDDWCYSCTSWVLVDSYDEVEETDETDNVEGPLVVESPYY
jgi:hypothetical protein